LSATDTRLAAADLLFRILEKRRTLDEAMAASEIYDTLTGADRGFARAIASAALRDLGRIDKGLAPLLTRPLNAVSPAVRALLRVGAAQLWVMGTPAHAAVSQTVEAARAWPDARAGGAFINAVLRRVAEKRAGVFEGPARALWPDWLAEAMQDSLGADGADALAAAQLTEPLLHLTARDDPARVAGATGGRLLPGGTIELPAGPVEHLPLFETGDWWVQDAAAALPAHLLTFARGDTVLDLCAAPGGKTLQLAARGAKVTAVDRSAPRLERLVENLARTRLPAEMIVADAAIWQAPQRYDYILLDAPCSAHGTLRRHPEGAWIKSQTDSARFTETQARLLGRALDLLTPGGQLVYCVCSPLAAEGRQQIAAIVSAGRARRVRVTDAELAGPLAGFADCRTPDGDLATVPSPVRACDAFYIARLTGT
jgi:16S rRNA (cytosine967-C5)-methyltransferase